MNPNAIRYTETQRLRNRKAQEAAERQGRMLGWMLVIEVIGFTVTIVIELLK